MASGSDAEVPQLVRALWPRAPDGDADLYLVIQRGKAADAYSLPGWLLQQPVVRGLEELPLSSHCSSFVSSLLPLTSSLIQGKAALCFRRGASLPHPFCISSVVPSRSSSRQSGGKETLF